MILIMTTSRGRGLTGLDGFNGAQLVVKPGWKTKKIAKLAVDIINSSKSPDKPIFVYFITGLPDLTYKKQKFIYLSHRRHKYQEVIINETPSQIHTRVEKILNNVAKCIKKLKSIPIFATITPMSIQTWNKHRLHHHRTSHLNHYNSYQAMQQTLEEATMLINSSIHKLNSLNNVQTPKLAKDIIYYRHGNLRTRYGKLPDGVHPNRNVISSWTNTMKIIIDKNTKSHAIPLPPPPPPPLNHIDTDMSIPSPPPPSPSVVSVPDSDMDSDHGSPKRSWKY